MTEGMEAGAGAVSIENTELMLDGCQKVRWSREEGVGVTYQQGTQPFWVTGP